MARQYSRNELYAFVWRADTPDKIHKAAEWLKKHVADNDLFDDLMTQLSIQSRNYYREKSGRLPI